MYPLLTPFRWSSAFGRWRRYPSMGLLAFGRTVAVANLAACFNFSGGSKVDTGEVNVCDRRVDEETCFAGTPFLPVPYTVNSAWACDAAPIEPAFYLYAAEWEGYDVNSLHLDGRELTNTAEFVAAVSNAFSRAVAEWYPVVGGPMLSRVDVILATGTPAAGSFGVATNPLAYLGNGSNDVVFEDYSINPDADLGEAKCVEQPDHPCRRLECDILIYRHDGSSDRGIGHWWDASAGTPPVGTRSLQTVFAHEFGHVLGLAHVLTEPITYSLMSSEGFGEGEAATVVSNDLTAASYIYGARP